MDLTTLLKLASVERGVLWEPSVLCIDKVAQGCVQVWSLFLNRKEPVSFVIGLLEREILVHHRGHHEVADQVRGAEVDSRGWVVEKGPLAIDALLLQPQEDLCHVYLVLDVDHRDAHLLQRRVCQVLELFNSVASLPDPE
eukprot:CAMPEP_0184301396 /NCGR_PEP_ID=MMETSP1049-20130417/11614_1 /TAXON_ID=77928 /ORGANISM="Proteomonas sulcata, Strain CCMP704" /LENGTH=139 /DNA_ID=CAMNT_0026612393 /DNA_START=362 /DNA_END=777 /DNA_ORIENTATION=+